MKLTPAWVRAELRTPGVATTQYRTDWTDETHLLGPLQMTVTTGKGDRVSWSVANRSDQPIAIRKVGLVFRVEARPPVRMFRHGYQSWSPSGMSVVGRDRDPSIFGAPEIARSAFHADPNVVEPGELRSEWVTILADDSGTCVLVGFDGSGVHDGTIRVTPDGPTVAAEAFLGDMVLPAGGEMHLHPVVIRSGEPAEASGLLADWASSVGGDAGARTEAPYQVGWCSWYQYFHGVTETAVLANLALATDWPFDVFQVDDGYQSAIGDWLTTSPSFPSGLEQLATRITQAGYRAGLWLAPFLVAPDSEVAAAHPDWLARRPATDGTLTPLFAWFNPPWGGGRDGLMYCLDTTNPEVTAHLESVARSVRELGFSYLKLDFTFAPTIDGVWNDTSLTPVARVRNGYAAIRRGAGEDVFILGCGVPLSHVVGLVDGVRIGQDVAPLWAEDAKDEIVPGYLDVQPATRMAYASTAARSFMHRRLWLNDPDCLMLRTTDTALSPEAAETWARAVAVTGGMALVSDDLSLVGPASRNLFDTTLAIGRESDAAVRTGGHVHVPDLLDQVIPTTIEAGRYRLVVDPVDGTSDLSSVPTSGA